MLRRILQSPPLCLSHTRAFRSREEATERIKKDIEKSKQNLEWRKPISQNPNEFQSKLALFGNEEQNSDMLTMLQQPIDLSPSSIKKWWIKRKERRERCMQQFISKRHEILGNDLAAAHFLVHRGGAVKFTKDKQWVRSNEEGEYSLPANYDATYKVEAIRCDNMELYYEGLENLQRLNYLKFLSFLNVKTFDDWSLDRVSGLENNSLEVLDLTGTNVTFRGLSSLYRIESLKVLVLDDPRATKEMELCCAMLEESLPKLRISAAKDIH